MTSYRRIEAVRTSLKVLRLLADQRGPVSGQEVARALDLPHGTVMSHLATLEDEGVVRKVGEHYELGMALALFWARRKANLEGTIARSQNELDQLEG